MFSKHVHYIVYVRNFNYYDRNSDFLNHIMIIRGGSWELAGSCVGCPIDGLRGLGGWPPPPTADGYSPMTAYNTTAEI